ncbi:related to cleft lip and palate transmembrane protein 1 (CLPTM1) [Melanopsichium pennsylvanicum]|uniref:Related to cleft lip and palate transmembrane protein 1 (CLPTM1) n=2 Tax=Melanopsichium pennsylvanicum TaxID=63383 RepID=A0AAJ4XLZ8_9BASI|nr:related to cleft lip and palate transmembrane protein 1 (CLPTM1) [Melanopsichium pennsylvanicum 4]SNX84297.1 related to cleft lip and palate transmembrane protein 1 (CLPTM1) [Melanopsichium pennsylvanicum]
MSSNIASASAQAAPADEPQRTNWKRTLTRAFIMYAGVQAVSNPKSPIAQYLGKMMGSNPTPAVPIASPSPSSAVSASSSATPSSAVPASPWAKPELEVKGPPNVAVPTWNDDALLDFYIFISSAPAPSTDMVNTQRSDLIPESGLASAPAIPFDAFGDLLRDPLHEEKREKVAYAAAAATGDLKPMAAVKWGSIPLSDTSLSKDVNLVLKLDDETRHYNGSVWADFVVTQHGVSPNPNDKAYHPFGVFRTRKLLSRLMPLKKKRVEKNLFNKNSTSTSAVQDEEEEQEQVKIVGHWHKNLTLALVQDKGDLGVQLSQLPPPVLQHVFVVRDPSSGSMVVAPPPSDPTAAAVLEQAYAAGRPPNVLRYPTIFPNDFWLLKEHMHPINSTVTELDLHIHLYKQTWFKFQTLAALSDSFDKQAGATGGEIDMLKTMLLETNPWFLALTIIVSILHSVFEFLAFSSDVKHWKNKDDLSGVSVGSIMTNIVVQVIITLYLLDNNEDTSWMILAGQAVGVVVECWKLTKAVSVGLIRAPARSLIPYRIKIEDKHKLSEEELKTQQYDKLAFKYVGIAIGPLLVGYTIYSALYQTHRGWWSFIISTATSFVYAFGFVSLVPQLIVNYKLKSTAGMNSKTFVYKILGTFVDDLFAFCIKMPTLHRLACFRDDVVFFIALYQRWIYGVDPTRRNEFGQVLDKKDHEKDDKKNDGKADVERNEKGETAGEVAKSSAVEAKTELKARVKAEFQGQ